MENENNITKISKELSNQRKEIFQENHPKYDLKKGYKYGDKIEFNFNEVEDIFWKK